MIEFDVDMAYLLHEEELDMVVLNDENGELPSVVFYPHRTCKDFGGLEGTNGEGYDFACSACGFQSDTVYPKMYHYCPGCGAKIIHVNLNASELLCACL